MSEARDVARWNLKIIRGATLLKPFRWMSGGAPVDLSGYTAKMQIRKKHGDPNVLLELTHLAGITLGGVAGTVQIFQTAAQTALFTFDRGVYDLELIAATDPPGTKRFLEGDVVVSPGVTE